MNKPITYIIVFVLLAFTGCIKTLTDDLKAKETKLVLNSVINPDSSLLVNISRTFNIFDDESTDNLPFVDNANIGLYENGNFLFNLDAIGNGYYNKPNFSPSYGNEYKLTATVQSFKDIESKVSFPNKVLIKEFDTVTVYHNDAYYNSKTLMGIIKYKDPLGERNYYQLKCRVFAPTGPDGEMTWYDQGVWVEENNQVLFDNSYGDILWNDKYTDGKEVSFRFGFYSLYDDYKKNSLENDTIRFVFSLQSVDEDYYLYLKTLHLYYESGGGDDPFMEPIVIHSNIENGYGIFGSFQQDTASFSYAIQIEGKGGEK